MVSIILTSFNNISELNYTRDNTEKSLYLVVSKKGLDYEISSLQMTKKEAENKKSQKDILIVEEDLYVQGCSNTDNKKDKHDKKVIKKSTKDSKVEWNIHTIKANNKSDKLNGNKVKIAIIDSGIDYTTDIDVYERKNFIPREDEVSIIYEDGSGHGTSIAGIIAAKDNEDGITGINPNVQLYSAKVLDNNNKAPISRVVEAIYWAIEKKVNIINISFSTKYDSDALKLAIHDAYSAGILIIAAAGNDDSIEYPAAYEEVMAVGAINSQGERSEKSATGEELEIVAPGEQILSTSSFGGVAVNSGTSIAVPHVAGVASVLWQKDLNCSSEFIRQLINKSANLYGESNEYGFGLIDQEYALKIYDKFKVKYKASDKNEEEYEINQAIQNNDSDIIIFDDIEYVEGRWAKDPTHTDLVVNSSYSAFNTTQLSIIKLDAKGNDNYILGMLLYPQWHGYWKKVVNEVKQYESNYISSYIYLTQVANKFVNNSYTAPPQGNMTLNDYNAMKNVITSSGINGYSWSTCLGGYSVNDTNKKLFVYGMAIHTATDVFAHSTYKLVNETWIYINHDMGADITSETPNRYACAQEIAKTIVGKCYNNNNIGSSASDFYLVSYNGSYKLKNISSYLACDYYYYDIFNSYLNTINLD